MNRGTGIRTAGGGSRPTSHVQQTLRSRRRCAFTLMEMTVALAIVSVTFVAIAQLLTSAVQQRRLIARRAAATQEASNVLDRIIARPWGDLRAGEVDDVALSPGFLHTTPTAKWSAEITDVPGPPIAKRVRVSIAWKNLAGETELPLTLFAWKYSEAAAP